MNRSFKPGFEKMASACNKFAGGSSALVIAIVLIVIWGVSGPLLGFSNTWQLIMNTFTSIVTFIMVFLIQHGQNKDSLAVQLKLNELIAAMKGASNRLVNAESLSEEELQKLKIYYDHLNKVFLKEKDVSLPHSIDEMKNQGSEGNNKE